MDLNGQVAIVTGGGRGLGKSIVERLAAAGASVAIVSLSIKENEALSIELNKQGLKSIPIKGDVTQYEDVKNIIQTTRSEFGKVDILVNNAGWDQIERFVESSEEDWIKVMDINLMSQLRMCREVLPHMVQQEYGRIINISSDAGRVGTSGQVAYSAAKGGVIAFTKGLAREVVKHGITVNCVCPGPINTPLYQEVVNANPKLTEAVARQIPMRRVGEPEDVSHFVYMFAVKEAGYVTGQTLSVSGGLTMI
jgi:2-hydroxycyclohexanecarboxyl-CoA dehydrogenase